MDLSNAFDTLNYNLLFAKLTAYDLDSNAAFSIKSYLTNRYQRCKIWDSFSEWKRVPQESILGPLLLNIENSGLCNYADDSTLYASGKFLSITIEIVKADSLRISKWSYEKLIVLSLNVILWYYVN